MTPAVACTAAFMLGSFLLIFFSLGDFGLTNGSAGMTDDISQSTASSWLANSCNLWIFGLSRPDSRPDPIGGSESVSGTRDSGMGLFFLKKKQNWHLWVWPTSYNIIKLLYTYLQSPIYIYKTELLLLQFRARTYM